MRELVMRNGRVKDARPECPDCDRRLCAEGETHACYNCNERFEVTDGS